MHEEHKDLKDALGRAAMLAKLNIEDEGKLLEDALDILNYIKMIHEVDTGDIKEPMFSPHQNSATLLREDRIKESLNKDEVLKLSPYKDEEDFYVVPEVVKGGN